MQFFVLFLMMLVVFVVVEYEISHFFTVVTVVVELADSRPDSETRKSEHG